MTIADLRLAVIGPVLLIALGCYGPVVPHPMPKKNRGIGGIELKQEPDISVIHAGTTTRAEIERDFATIDAGLHNERLFVGRWSHSGMGISGDRIWGERNLLIAFDALGLVQKFTVCSDDQLLKLVPAYWERDALAQVLSVTEEQDVELPGLPNETSQPGPTGWGWTHMRLDADSIRVSDLIIPRDKIKGITAECMCKFDVPKAEQFVVSIQFHEKIKGKKSLSIIVSTKGATLLAGYVGQPRTSTRMDQL